MVLCLVYQHSATSSIPLISWIDECGRFYDEDNKYIVENIVARNIRFCEIETDYVVITDSGAVVTPLFRAKIPAYHPSTDLLDRVVEHGLKPRKALWVANKLVKIVSFQFRKRFETIKEKLLDAWSDNQLYSFDSYRVRDVPTPMEVDDVENDSYSRFGDEDRILASKFHLVELMEILKIEADRLARYEGLRRHTCEQCGYRECDLFDFET
jgi:hypothetical protein